MFAESLTEHMLTNGAHMRDFAEAYVSSRARIGLPSVPVETIIYARAVEIVAERMRRVDLLTGRDVAAAVRSTKAEVWREERQRQFQGLVKGVIVHVHSNRARLSLESKMENQARVRVGKPREPGESLVVWLATREIAGRVPTGSLSIEEARNAVRIAGLHLLTSPQAHRHAGDDQTYARWVGR
ncbi:hypothetical protein E3O06_03850 [Cryobacterium glaciale]|uniref:Uncharacterized protein n=1 Tax=Cryobacterium glaciale TaxID=1259145 RepID=A0A4R8V2K0_9MICO|nr:hypothetical protein [Cryobacterium glaciale]TFB76489.1 hypothetical protein E3O06_03850 [Cryobacterium glaciale]